MHTDRQILYSLKGIKGEIYVSLKFFNVTCNFGCSWAYGSVRQGVIIIAVQVLSCRRPRGRANKSPNTRSRRAADAAPPPPQSMQIAGSNLLLSPQLLSKCILNSEPTTPAFVPSFSLNLMCSVDFNGNIWCVLKAGSWHDLHVLKSKFLVS